MLDYNQQGHCVTLTINRPDMRNALGEPGDGDVFTEACARINQDRSVRCVILTGAGSAFSAGGNIKAMQEGRPPFGGPGVHIADSYRQGIHRIIRSLWQLEVPAIAAVNGPAIGLGNDVASLCDIRIAAKKRHFRCDFFKNRADTRRWWGLVAAAPNRSVARQRIAVYRQNNSCRNRGRMGTCVRGC